MFFQQWFAILSCVRFGGFGGLSIQSRQVVCTRFHNLSQRFHVDFRSSVFEVFLKVSLQSMLKLVDLMLLVCICMFLQWFAIIFVREICFCGRLTWIHVLLELRVALVLRSIDVNLEFSELFTVGTKIEGALLARMHQCVKQKQKNVGHLRSLSNKKN